MFAAGTRTSLHTISPVGLARRLILPWMVGVSKPSMPRSTTKPRIDSGPPSSTFAHTSARSAMGELVIHILVPLRM